MQFVTYKEAKKTGGNFYSEKEKTKTQTKPKQNKNTKPKQSGKRERERELRRQCSVDKIKPCESIL